MDWIVTLILTGALGAAAALFGWLGARPPNPMRGPRLVPWRFLMVLCAFCLVLLVVHMANLAGMNTGAAAPPPMGPHRQP